MPLEEPIPFRSYSAGEELSTKEITALAWSQIGLAKHKRCALALLTQNLALSIWTSGSRPRTPYSWSRRLVINQELDAYFSEIFPVERRKPGKDKSEKLKRLQRIRAFTWSPRALFSSVSNQKSSAHSQIWGEHFLGVANDNCEIIIMWISSQSNLTSDDGSELASQALAHFPVDTDIQMPDLSWTFEDYMNHHKSATHVAWSPWVQWQDGSLVAIIAYTSHSKIGFRQINISMSSEGPRVQVGDQEASVMLAIPDSVNGPLRWLPEVSKAGRMQLVVSAGTSILQFDMAAIGNIDIKRSRYIRRGDWDPISGM